MMKYRLLILLFFTLNKGNGQTITYQLYVKNPCGNRVESTVLYSLEKNGNLFIPLDSTGKISLHEEGIYRLKSLMFEDTVELRFENNTSNIDTLSCRKVYECLEPTSHPRFIGYCCCEQECNGYQTDYYSNGKLRLEGNFKKGIPVGELKVYNSDGSLKKLYIYDKKGRGKIRKEVNSDYNKQ